MFEMKKLPNKALTVLVRIVQVVAWIVVGSFLVFNSKIYLSEHTIISGFPWWYQTTVHGWAQFVMWFLWTAAFPVWWLFRHGQYLNLLEKMRREFYDSLKGIHIDEVLTHMPPPTKSVKHRGSSFISYYWTKTTRSGGGFSIPVGKGIRMFSGSASSSKQTLCLMVNPETSLVIDWTYSDT